MAQVWEMGMEFGIGVGSAASSSAADAAATAAPGSNSFAYLYGLPSADTLRVDDLLDFSNQEDLFSSPLSAAEQHLLPPSEPSAFTMEADSSSNQYSYPSSGSFTDDIYIPSEEAAELEWLSRFVDDSFSDIPYTAPSAYQVPPVPSAHHHHQHQFHADTSSAPGRGVRSKRSRGIGAGTAAANWSVMQPPPPQSSPSTTSSSSSSDFPLTKPRSTTNSSSHSSASISNKGNKGGAGDRGDGGGMRRCTHCASEKTPQWRTGPLGPKTLCNACGVRYKSGRLVPEYRPAASPTFVLTQHSNSHRKVLELRRQKELLLLRQDKSAAAVAAAMPELLYHDHTVC